MVIYIVTMERKLKIIKTIKMTILKNEDSEIFFAVLHPLFDPYFFTILRMSISVYVLYDKISDGSCNARYHHILSVLAFCPLSVWQTSN